MKLVFVWEARPDFRSQNFDLGILIFYAIFGCCSLRKFNFLNEQHPNIAFTMECESDGRLSFLDCQVYREKNGFPTSVFRKSTFSGLGSGFFSFCFFRFKINSIKTLISRWLNVCSNYTDMHCELNFLKLFLHQTVFQFPLLILTSRSFYRIGLYPHH